MFQSRCFCPRHPRQAKRRPRLHRLRVEPLENRRLLAVVTVDTALDVVDANDGLTSLREAIVATNVMPGADEIVFDFGHDGPATILLKQGELEVTDALAITGDGPDLLTIDAEKQSRIFNITATTGDFKLVGMTLTGGQTTGENEDFDDTTFSGGAIRSVASGTLTLDNSAVTNSAVSGVFFSSGGGLFAVGNVAIVSSTISGNSASGSGGGISTMGDVTVRSSRISGNSSKSGLEEGLVGGGGILAVGDVAVESTMISGNSARYNGGGIGATGDVTVSSSTIAGNSAEGGGGIEASGNVVVHSSTISENLGMGDQQGLDMGPGGIGGRDVTVVSSTISGNSGAFGGGIGAFGDVIVRTSTISENVATIFYGGGIDASENVTIDSSTVSGNSATEHGGGIHARGDVTVQSSTISGNMAGGSGGGLASNSRATNVTIANSILAGNQDNGNGPDLSRGSSPGTLTVRHSLIGDNRGTDLMEAPLGSPDDNGNLIGGPVGGAIDPRLGRLTDNGGVTPTHALLPDSPAIDAGDPLTVAGVDNVPFYDQRGEPYARVQAGRDAGVARIDMGAHERQSLTANIVSVTSPRVTPSDEVTVQFTTAVQGFDVGDLRLSRNDGENLLIGGETLSSSDNQTFVVSGLAGATTIAGNYTLSLIVSGSEITSSDGAPLDSGTSTTWAMGRPMLGLTVDTLIDEADGRIDDGDVSLRDAIASAVPGETIRFDDSLAGGTILLTLGELLITRPLTIDATELTTGLVIDASGNDPTPAQDDRQGSRIFAIDDSNPVGDSPVILRGLTLTGGDVAGAGGAVHTRETLTIEASVISGNAVGWIDSGPSSGGGVYASGSVTIHSSTIAGNSAWEYGGGIGARDVTVSSSTIAGNSAISGGGISGGRVMVLGSEISANEAGARGGGIRAENVTIRSSIISGNVSTSSSMEGNFGGGISARNVTVSYSTIWRNEASNKFNGARSEGGGIHASAVTVRSSTISENSPGGISARQATVRSSTVSGNAGGGISASGDVTIANSILAGNQKDGPDLVRGRSPGALTIRNSLIGDNRGTELSEAPVGSPDANGNLVGGPVGGVIDPRLGPLTSNGGATPTHALLPGSPAINAGDASAVAGMNDVPLHDHRGAPFWRVADGGSGGVARIDMGAHERQSLTAKIIEVPSTTVTPVDAVTIRFTSTVSHFELSDLELSLNDSENLLTGNEILSTVDNQTFVLSELSNVTTAAGFYTLRLIALADPILDAAGGPLDSGTSMSWTMESPSGLTVDTLIDEIDGRIDDGDTSLRDAIAAAAPGATIGFDSSLDGGTIQLTMGDVLLARPVILDATALASGLVIDAASNDPTPSLNDGQGSRIFTIDDSSQLFDSPVTIRGLTLRGGDVDGSGGAIHSRETLTIESVSISENAARLEGGGVWVVGNATVTSSTISGNTARTAEGAGGGIWVSGNLKVTSSQVLANAALRGGEGGGIRSSGDVEVSHSTISGNVSEGSGGGGIYADGDVAIGFSMVSENQANFGGGILARNVTVESSTISGNDGGGIRASGDATVISSTISGNTDSSGGGISVRNNLMVRFSTITGNAARGGGGGGISAGKDVAILHSIVAANRDDGRAPDLERQHSPGTVTVLHTLIGDNRGSSLSEAPVGSPDANGNLIGGPVGGAIDPRLGALVDNGGVTPIHTLAPDSPAIDAGDHAATAGVDGVPRYDQRDEPFLRVADGNGDGVARIDMGAHERQKLTVNFLEIPSPATTPVEAVTLQFNSVVTGFDLDNLRLSLNNGGNLLTADQAIGTTDNQTFVLSGLSELTTAVGYYTLTLVASASPILDTAGGPLDPGASVSWAMERGAFELTVDTLIDEADERIDDGDVSLRDAISAAPPGATINFDASLDGGTILLTLGELAINRALTVDATGLANGLVIDASGNDPTPDANDGQGSRVFVVEDSDPFADSPVVTIRGLTLTGGDVNSEGGAIHTRESLSLESVSISENWAASEGGAIWALGDVTLSSSTISGNTAGGEGVGGGGGIRSFGDVTVVFSTISGNISSFGGGIFASGNVHVRSSTISRNSVSQSGGGISARDVTISSSTISGNSGFIGFGGGIRATGDLTIISSTVSRNMMLLDGGGIHASGNVIIANSILAGNESRRLAGPDLFRDSTAGTITLRHSLIGDNRGTDLAEAPLGSPDANGNLIGGPAGGIIAPRLGPLMDNGGATATHALLPDSPAIDSGDPLAVPGIDDVPEFDQRGAPYSRVVDGRIDMGAFERGVDGDANVDGKVDFADFLSLSFSFGKNGGWIQGDFDGDGTVGFSDFLILSSNFGFDSTGPEVVFHLDFNGPIQDASARELPIVVGSSVVPNAEGPTLATGTQLQAGQWTGTNDDDNQILLLDHPILDKVSQSAGAIVTWINVDDENQWNNIAKTVCPQHEEPCPAFSRNRGIELQATATNGVFGSIQGYSVNNFGPAHASNGGPGGTETPSNQWVHVALAWNDRGQRTVYVNGIPGKTIAALTDESFGLNEPEDWSIGGDGLPSSGDPNGRRLSGRLADFAILLGELDEATLDEIIQEGIQGANLAGLLMQ